MQANKKLVKALSSSHVAQKVLVLPSWCMQHQVCLITSPLARGMDVSAPLFCMAKLLSGDKYKQQLVAGMRAVVASELRFVKAMRLQVQQGTPQSENITCTGRLSKQISKEQIFA